MVVSLASALFSKDPPGLDDLQPPLAVTGDDLQRLMGWLEREVKLRLDLLDEKVDKILDGHGDRAPHRYDTVRASRAGKVRQPTGDRGTRRGNSKGRTNSKGRSNSKEVSDGASKGVNGRTQEPPHSDGPSVDNDVNGVEATPELSGPDISEKKELQETADTSRQLRVSDHISNVDEQEIHRERMQFMKSRERTMYLDRMWQLLEDPESSTKAHVYEKCMVSLITVSFFLALLQAIDTPFWGGAAASFVDLAIDFIFVIEIVFRFAVCPNRRSFFHSMYNIIDMISLLPLGLRLYLGVITPDRDQCTVACLVLLGCQPILRLMKMLRRFQQFHLLLKAFKLAFEAMPIMLFIYALLMLTFTALLYVVEPHGNVESFFHAWWLAIVSMTTLGYGDVIPKSDAGKVIVGCCIFASALYMAIPLGIIGNAFNDVWKNRDHILLMQRTRTRLEQAGYTANDIPMLFKLFDCDRNGQLDVLEFQWMLQGMRLGLKKERVVELYEAFDDDKSGGIDPIEFVKALFPDAYYDMYGETSQVDCESHDLQFASDGSILGPTSSMSISRDWDDDDEEFEEKVKNC